MPLEFGEKVRRIPVYPAADGYALGGPGREARLQRERRTRRSPRSSRRSRKALARRSTATPTRRTPRCARGCRTATACPPTGSRSATARATSCSPPATRCSSPAPRSSTRGRRFSVYPHLAAASGARAIEVPVDAEHQHDLDGDARGDHRRHAARRSSATRTTRRRPRCRSSEIAAFVDDVPRARRA